MRGYRIRSGTPTDVLEAYETRIPLEHLAASLAAKRHTELELAALRLLHTHIGESQSLGEARELHTRFHETIWEAAHNSTLESTLRRITSQLRIYDRSTTIPDDRETILAEHDAILLAIGQGDAVRAGELARAHLERTRESRLLAFATQSSGLAR
jgi:DNA-binding GntR family transcriptional regulator